MQHVGQSVKVWLTAAGLESELKAKKRVLRKGKPLLQLLLDSELCATMEGNYQPWIITHWCLYYSESCCWSDSTVCRALACSHTSQDTCQGTTCFLLWKHLGVFPTPTLDTFSILWTPTASKFQRHFRVLLILSPFQQSPTLLHTPSTLTPCLTLPPEITPRPPPPLKVARRPLWTLYPLIQTPLWHSSETLLAITELGQLPWHPILRVESLRQYAMSRVDGGQDQWGMPGNGPDCRLV